MSWSSAIAHCRSLNYNGFTDWTLPDTGDMIRLHSLGLFPSSSYYWTTDRTYRYRGHPQRYAWDNAVVVNPANGAVSSAIISYSHAVVCIR
jgi:hypothetical protein